HGSVHVWIDNRRSLTAAATCIGPLSTLTTNRATRISQINCNSEVWLVKSMQFSGGSILFCDCPTMTTRVGENARQSSSITAFESDLPPPLAKGGRRMKGGWAS